MINNFSYEVIQSWQGGKRDWLGGQLGGGFIQKRGPCNPTEWVLPEFEDWRQKQLGMWGSGKRLYSFCAYVIQVLGLMSNLRSKPWNYSKESPLSASREQRTHVIDSWNHFFLWLWKGPEEHEGSRGTMERTSPRSMDVLGFLPSLWSSTNLGQWGKFSLDLVFKTVILGTTCRWGWRIRNRQNFTASGPL